MPRIVDQEPQWYSLKEVGGDLFLTAFCEHSFFSFDFTIQMNQEEVAAYQREGRVYLGRLADEIQNSAPAARNSTSRFKGREVAGGAARR